jgi:hypothetical protein
MSLQAWVVPSAILGGFLALASVGQRRSWRFPAAAAFTLVWAGAAALTLLATRSAVEPTLNLHSVSPATRSGIALLFSLTIFLGIVAATFRLLRRKSTLVRIACTVGSGFVAYALALAGGLYATCLLDLGCL